VCTMVAARPRRAYPPSSPAPSSPLYLLRPSTFCPRTLQQRKTDSRSATNATTFALIASLKRVQSVRLLPSVMQIGGDGLGDGIIR
jgi:hypothetical protein